MNTPPLPRQEDLATLRVLEEIERKPDISQREMSRSIGVSLGLTNLLVRRMITKAWIKVSSIPGRRVLYALTPKGMAEKIRKTRDFVRLSYRYYSDLKQSIADRIRDCGRPRAIVAGFGAGDMDSIVREAVERAGGRYLGSLEAGGVRGTPDVVVLLAKPSRADRERWEREGSSLIDFS